MNKQHISPLSLPILLSLLLQRLQVNNNRLAMNRKIRNQAAISHQIIELVRVSPIRLGVRHSIQLVIFKPIFTYFLRTQTVAIFIRTSHRDIKIT